MSRSFYIFGNWKMSQSLQLVAQFFENFDVDFTANKEVAVFPSAPHLYQTLEYRKAPQIRIGAQDCSAHKEGAFTGEISASQIGSLGCTDVLIGHSERRQYHAEGNPLIREKIKRANEAGLRVCLCVGESLKEREAGQLDAVLKSQLEVLDVSAENLLIAYEPVWAIGTGKVASLEEIEEAHKKIGKISGGRPCLYGGSVKPENAKEILSLSAVSGVLVGGASLKAESFSKIYESCP